MRIVEVRQNLLIADSTQTPEYQSVKLHPTGARRLRNEFMESQIRANKRNSKLSPDWRDSFGAEPIEAILYNNDFHRLVRSLDRVSRADLMWQVFQEVWPKIKGNIPIASRDDPFV